ncbi:glycosyltransferase family 4 protein [Marinobacter bohaiensis]|uniref:glycosyltransferase family 4 protein n=1 Tax=Marinobacter bohaiensis TaxID=2201898 RepID=UPI000DAC37DF|nr:glycosyltransferase family 4 protein [Marinobacter bohaiensis]
MAKKYRVLLVVRWPVGGIRTFLKYVFRFFPGQDVLFSVIAVDSEGGRLLKEELYNSVEDFWLVDESSSVAMLSLSVAKKMKNKHYDLVHAHGFTSAIAAITPCLIFRKRLLLTSHDVLNSKQFCGFLGNIKKWLLALVLNSCSKVHSVSFDAERNLKEMLPFFDLDHSIVILNGVDSEQFVKAQARDLKAELGLSNDKTVIGFFGRFMAQKGFRYLVQSVEKLKSDADPLCCHVICFGSGAYIREEKSDIERRGLDDYFSFVPFIPDVSGAMKGCDVIVMPSLWEACPLQPMEALCSGVPFVGTSCIGLREVLKGTPAVVADVGSADSLAESIRDCVAKGRAPFSDYQATAARRFEVRSTVDAIYNLYLRVLE